MEKAEIGIVVLLLLTLLGRYLASPGQYNNNNAFDRWIDNYPHGIWTDWLAPPNADYYSHYHGSHLNMSVLLRTYAKAWVRRRSRSTRRCLVAMASRRVRDSDCMEEFPFICARWSEYWRFGNTICNSYDKLYRYYSTGSCYKLHKNGMEWQAALIKCRAEGGELAILDSSGEGNVFSSILKAAENDTIKIGYGYNQAFLGFYYYHTHHSGNWASLRGKYQFHIRSDDQAYRDDPPHSCLGWHVQGFYTSMNCAVPHRFICEKNPYTPL